MLLFRSDPFGGTHELLPCGLLGGDLVKLFRKSKSKYYWYDFTVRDERYRGSTKETNESRAQKAASLSRFLRASTGNIPTNIPTFYVIFAGSVWRGVDRCFFKLLILLYRMDGSGRVWT